MAVFKGASDDMYVGQRSLQVQKQMDTFFKICAWSDHGQSLRIELYFIVQIEHFRVWYEMQVIPGVGGHPPHWFNIWGSLCESLWVSRPKAKTAEEQSG